MAEAKLVGNWQFKATQWFPGVKHPLVNSRGGYNTVLMHGERRLINPGDWIVSYYAIGYSDLWTDKEFKEYFYVRDDKDGQCTHRDDEDSDNGC